MGLCTSDSDIAGLICKHILGETSDQENRRMQDWLSKSADNRDRYNEIKLILDSVRDAKCPHDFNINAAWTKFKSRLARRTGK